MGSCCWRTHTLRLVVTTGSTSSYSKELDQRDDKGRALNWEGEAIRPMGAWMGTLQPNTSWQRSRSMDWRCTVTKTGKTFWRASPTCAEILTTPTMTAKPFCDMR